MPPVFRFAPSPNGYLHLGHAYSALLNFDLARRTGGRFLLRIEDIDTTRCKAEFETAIYDDLAVPMGFSGFAKRVSLRMGLFPTDSEKAVRNDCLIKGFFRRRSRWQGGGPRRRTLCTSTRTQSTRLRQVSNCKLTTTCLSRRLLFLV